MINNISKEFDQKLLKEILIKVYEEGQENKDIKVIDIINGIKSRIESVMVKPN